MTPFVPRLDWSRKGLCQELFCDAFPQVSIATRQYASVLVSGFDPESMMVEVSDSNEDDTSKLPVPEILYTWYWYISGFGSFSHIIMFFSVSGSIITIQIEGVCNGSGREICAEYFVWANESDTGNKTAAMESIKNNCFMDNGFRYNKIYVLTIAEQYS